MTERIDGRCQFCGWPCDKEFCSDQHWELWVATRVFAEQLAEMSRQFRAMAEALRPILAQAGESIRRFRQAAIDAGMVPDKAPTDPKTKALWAVHNRNTGPMVHADPRKNKRAAGKRA